MRRATKKSDASWELLLEIDPDIALLQEVNSIPDDVASHYSILQRKATGKTGKPQLFSTAILVRGSIDEEITLSSSWGWVNEELQRFTGNLVAAVISLNSGERFRAMSVYSPAWPIDRERLEGVDVSKVKLKDNPDVWVTELVWAALCDEERDGVPWIVAGDLNSSVTFDTLWGNKPRGNQEIQDRMTALGFVECLLFAQGKLTPTFMNTTGEKIIHQMDHLFIPEKLLTRLSSCITGDALRVFKGSLSDHLPVIATLE